MPDLDSRFNAGPHKLVRALLLLGLALLAMGTISTPALADPCEAAPRSGPVPDWLKPGRLLEGPVVYVGDGDSLCIAAQSGRRADPDSWVEIRLADFYAPELSTPEGRAAKKTVERLVMGQRLTCRSVGRSYDRVVARCSLRGQDLSEILRRSGVIEGGSGWRRPAPGRPQG